MTHRIAQVESTLQRVVADVLQRSLSDPRVEGLVSVTKVKVSDDMSSAVVYVSVLPEEKQKTTLKGLEHAAIHIQALAKKKLALRRVPRLMFREDSEIKRVSKTLGAIREAVERSGIEGETADGSGAGDGTETSITQPAGARPSDRPSSATENS